MARNDKLRRGGSEQAHALERVVQEVSADSFEGDLGVREDIWARQVRRALDAKLVRLRAVPRPARPAERRATHISAELRALDRAALLARLDVLQKAPTIQIEYLKLSRLPIEDLRLLVATLEATRSSRELSK